jgi:hypothetical protein
MNLPAVAAQRHRVRLLKHVANFERQIQAFEVLVL